MTANCSICGAPFQEAETSVRFQPTGRTIGNPISFYCHPACVENLLRGLPGRRSPDQLPLPRDDAERLAEARACAGRAILALSRATGALQRLSDAARDAMEALREVNSEIWDIQEEKERDHG